MVLYVAAREGGYEWAGRDQWCSLRVVFVSCCVRCVKRSPFLLAFFSTEYCVDAKIRLGHFINQTPCMHACTAAPGHNLQPSTGRGEHATPGMWFIVELFQS